MRRHKLRALGGMKEIYEPAYVEDLDLGYRGWQRGWPTVFVSAARVLHRHRATTSKYYSSEQLQAMVEVNYLRFLASTVVVPAALPEALEPGHPAALRARGSTEMPAAAQALLAAPQMPLLLSGGDSSFPEERILALGNGQHAVFPARRPRNKPVVLILSPYPPFPLAHGGAVRMYNLMRRAAADFEQVLLSFCDRLETPPRELCDICVEIILVERAGNPRPSIQPLSGRGRGVPIRNVSRRPRADHAKMAAANRATGVHADGTVRRRLRAGQDPSRGTRCHFRPLRAASAPE